MNRFEQFKQEFMKVKLEELAEYIIENFSQEELCRYCSYETCNNETVCIQGVINYLKEEVNG